MNRLARLSSTVMVMTIRNVVMVVVLTGVMVVRDWRLAVIALVVFPFIGLAVRTIGRRLYRINRRSQRKVAELNVLLHEVLSGTKIVKAFGREAHEVERFDRVNRGLLSLALKDHRADQLTEPFMEVLTALGIMGALWYGGHQVIAGTLTPGDFFSFPAAVALLYGPVRQALPDRQHRPAVERVGRARLRDHRFTARHHRPARRRRLDGSAARSCSTASASATPTPKTSRCATSR